MNFRREHEALPMGEPSDIANLVVFLASNESAYLTGQAIRVAGGVNLFVF